MAITDMLKGVRIPGAVVTINVAGVGGVQNLFQQSNMLVAQVGTRSFRIKKLMIQNAAAGNCYVHIGTGIAVDRFPPIYSINGMTDEYGENEIPQYEFFADATAYADVLIALGAILISCEVEEIG